MLKNGISLIMPCLNEELTLDTCIKKAKKSLNKIKTNYEIIIADNGSTDNSIKIAKRNKVKVINVKEKGYGAALLGGIKAAKYKFIIMGDADDSYDFLNIDEFINKLNQGYELVMGNRFMGRIEPGAMSFSHKYIGNPILSGIGRILYKTNIRDWHCGLRAFRKDSIDSLSLTSTGMEFASEMVIKASLQNLKTIEIPTKLYKDGRNRPPHLRSIPDGIRHLKMLFSYNLKDVILYGYLFVLMLILIIK